jgi:lactate permease
VFHQLLTPVGDSLALSFAVALLPIAILLLMLGILRRPAWQAAGAGLLAGVVIAVSVWKMPPSLALAAAAGGAVFAFWPVMWIVISALLLYNIAVTSGRFDAFREWVTTNLPNDRRVVLIVIGFCFGALLEGIAGFGAPVAITASLLILVGFPALDALVFVLIFDTTPVAFGALGAPVTVLAAVTGLPAASLAAMIGRQLPLIAAILPFYVTALYGGWRSLRALWPMLLVAGLSFGAAQFAASNFFDYTLADIFSALASLVATILFLQFWKPAPDDEFQIDTALRVDAVPRLAGSARVEVAASARINPWSGWLPWLIVSATVILWTLLKVARFGQQSIHWPLLDNAIAITLYDNKPYAAVWLLQPLGTGTAILAAALATAICVRLTVRELLHCIALTIRQIWLAVVTVMLIVALAYVMNYSGIAYSLGLAAASAGRAFVLFSPFLGWIAVFLSGSDTSGNALFGNLQVVAARQLQLNPLLFAATNSSGGVLGKMISPQNIATGLAVTNLKGQEGAVLARTFWHSVVLTLLLVVIVIVQQYVIPGVIPALER